MIKRKISLTLIIIVSAILLAIALSVILAVFDKERLTESVYAILLEIDKALIITIILGSVTKIVSSEIFSVKTNDRKMRRLGIYSIGEGRLDKKQASIMFGGGGYLYPRELKFCFISGNAFMEAFRPQIMKAIENGCHLKLLIANPTKSASYLERAERICPQGGKDGSYINQCLFTLNFVKEMQREIDEKGYFGKIEIKHYHDEYRYNYRIAKYYDKEKGEIIRTWVNFQPLIKDAIEQSLTVIGRYDEEYVKEELSRSDKESQSIVLSLDKSFDELWELY